MAAQCPYKLPPSGIAPYPPFTVEPTEQQSGILDKLQGEWVNAPGVYGLHTTIMPAPGTSDDQVFGAFHFKTQEYTEVLNFQQGPGPVRNRLGANEQFNSAMTYDTTIKDRNGVIQHFENGMYLWAGEWVDQVPVDEQPYNKPPNLFSRKTTEEDVKQDFLYPVVEAGTQGKQFIPPYSISRSGVIPHGNTIHLMGNITETNAQGTPTITSTDVKGKTFKNTWNFATQAVDKTMGIKPDWFIENDEPLPRTAKKPERFTWPINTQYPPPEGGYKPGEVDPLSGAAYFQRIFNATQILKDKDGKQTLDPLYPYCVQPNFKLIEAIEDCPPEKKVVSYDMFELDTVQDTGLQGGILNNVGVQRYTKPTRMRLRMWIEKLADGTEQLQYEQTVFFQFQFGANGTKTQWPHIQVNTLVRKSKETQPFKAAW